VKASSGPLRAWYVASLQPHPSTFSILLTLKYEYRRVVSFQRDTRTLNYTYPELLNWASLSGDAKAARIRTDINAMYGQTAAWATIDPGAFNVSASVPTSKVAVTSFGSKPAAPSAKIVVPPPSSTAAPAAKAAEPHGAAPAPVAKVLAAVPPVHSGQAQAPIQPPSGAFPPSPLP